MIKYRVFFLNNGSIYDAYKNEVIDIEIEKDSIEDVNNILTTRDFLKELRKDLTFVILPVFVRI